MPRKHACNGGHDAEGAKENGDDESKTDEGGEKSSPSSLKTKGAMKEVVRKDFYFFTVRTFLHKLNRFFISAFFKMLTIFFSRTVTVKEGPRTLSTTC